MSTFQTAFNNIADAIKDLASLEVVTYKGRISIGTKDGVPAGTTDGDPAGATDGVPATFEDVLKNAGAKADFQITACTKVLLDGDMQVFYDKDITDEEIQSHTQLVKTAAENRKAVVDLFKDAIVKQIEAL